MGGMLCRHGGGRRKKKKKQKIHNTYNHYHDDFEFDEDSSSGDDSDSSSEESWDSFDDDDGDPDMDDVSGGGGDGGWTGLDMYGGGEDERPGGDPPAPGSFAARLTKKDYASWFAEHVPEDRTACAKVIGRSDPIPYPWEVIIQEGYDYEQEDGAGILPGICLVTQCSVDRLEQLKAQLEVWDGELSAAVFIDAHQESREAERQRRLIQAAYKSAERKRRQRQAVQEVSARTITVVYKIPSKEVQCEAYDTLYPVNKLRNEALRAVQSQLVFLVDVDFMPSKGLYKSLAGEDEGETLYRSLAAKRRHAPRALVIPAFEVGTSPEQKDALSFAGLKAAYTAGNAFGFHMWYFPQGHVATNFDRWFKGKTSLEELQTPSKVLSSLCAEKHGVDAYRIKYSQSFEPYVVAAKSAVPEYDERFRGYGMNKISHIYEMAKRGFKFYVVDTHEAFLVSKWHPRSDSWQSVYGRHADKDQLQRIAAHYRIFSEELCCSLLKPSEEPRKADLVEVLKESDKQEDIAAPLTRTPSSGSLVENASGGQSDAQSVASSA
mmetsp:Transcript_13170/g.24304  ORF Transcript_13170/g.24304 Transcript_13170/m.24304 type:complete len:548 (-) Transcript_13170:164-1807(-)